MNSAEQAKQRIKNKFFKTEARSSLGQMSNIANAHKSNSGFMGAQRQTASMRYATTRARAAENFQRKRERAAGFYRGGIRSGHDFSKVGASVAFTDESNKFDSSMANIKPIETSANTPPDATATPKPASNKPATVDVGNGNGTGALETESTKAAKEKSDQIESTYSESSLSDGHTFDEQAGGTLIGMRGGKMLYSTKDEDVEANRAAIQKSAQSPSNPFAENRYQDEATVYQRRERKAVQDKLDQSAGTQAKKDAFMQDQTDFETVEWMKNNDKAGWKEWSQSKLDEIDAEKVSSHDAMQKKANAVAKSTSDDLDVNTIEWMKKNNPKQYWEWRKKFTSRQESKKKSKSDAMKNRVKDLLSRT